MGWENVFHCEIEPFCQKVLKYYWPNAKSYEDITKTNFTIWRGKIDILTGGFPCQPYSSAGKRLGKEDERHLWPEMLRAIREIQPTWIVGENVYGLFNWSEGLVFEEVCADLEAEGYKVQPCIIPAAGVGAPHKRDRIWFIAYRESYGDRRRLQRMEKKNGSKREPKEHRKNNGQFRNNGKKRNAPNANGNGQQGSRWPKGQKCSTKKKDWQKHRAFDDSRWPTQSPVRGRNDGISSELVGITFPKHRKESLKGYGNAVVPQVVYQIFKAIEQYETLNK